MSLIATSTITPVEPVTLDEVKARLKLTTTADDATITQQITVARRYAEKVTRCSLAYKSYSLFLDRFPFPREPIRLLAPPLISVLDVMFLDDTLTQQTWAPDDYFIAYNNRPALIVPVPGIIYPDTAHVPGAVQIDFTAGYGYPGVAASGNTPAIPSGEPIPPDVAEGIRQLTIHIYEHPEVVTGDELKEAPSGFSRFFGSNKIYEF